MSTRRKSKQGFASLSEERRREIASMGGKAAHASGNAHEFTPEEASAAGKKGACHDREHMRRIGKIGGQNKKSLPATKTTRILNS